MLFKFELFDSAGEVMVCEGTEIRNEHKNDWQEALVPENETLIGFKVVSINWFITTIALVTAKSC